MTRPAVPSTPFHFLSAGLILFLTTKWRALVLDEDIATLFARSRDRVTTKSRKTRNVPMYETHKAPLNVTQIEIATAAQLLPATATGVFTLSIYSFDSKILVPYRSFSKPYYTFKNLQQKSRLSQSCCSHLLQNFEPNSEISLQNRFHWLRNFSFETVNGRDFDKQALHRLGLAGWAMPLQKWSGSAIQKGHIWHDTRLLYHQIIFGDLDLLSTPLCYSW